jgi:hypothetical protein
LGDIDEAVRQLGVFFAANPGADAGYRAAVENGELPWPLQPLVDQPKFLSLINAR